MVKTTCHVLRQSLLGITIAVIPMVWMIDAFSSMRTLPQRRSVPAIGGTSSQTPSTTRTTVTNWMLPERSPHSAMTTMTMTRFGLRLQSKAKDDFDDMEFDPNDVGFDESELEAEADMKADIVDVNAETVVEEEEEDDVDDGADEDDDDDIVLEEDDYVDEDDEDEYEYEYEYYEEEEEDTEASLEEDDYDDYEDEDDADIYLNADDDDDDVEEYDEDGQPIKKRKKRKPKTKKKKKKPKAKRTSGSQPMLLSVDEAQMEYTDEDEEKYYEEWSAVRQDAADEDDDDEFDDDEYDDEEPEEEHPNYIRQMELIQENAKYADERVERSPFVDVSQFLTVPPDSGIFDVDAVYKLTEASSPPPKAEHTDTLEGALDSEEYDDYNDEEEEEEEDLKLSIQQQAEKEFGDLHIDAQDIEEETIDAIVQGRQDESPNIMLEPLAPAATTTETTDDDDKNDDTLMKAFSYPKEDMDYMTSTWKRAQQALKDTSELNKVMELDTKSREDFNFTEHDIDEIQQCCQRIGASSYNFTRYLLYDRDFNVTNLVLAAFKHSPDAPIVLMHWYPQLCVYERYQYVRDRDFDFTWEDVEAADMSELELYYQGMGYTDIPKKAPHETGVIKLSEMDEEEQKMAGFEAWFNEVYNPNMDRVDFDEPGLEDEDNVFSDAFKYYENPENPSIQDMSDDLDEWRAEMGDDLTEEQKKYRDYVANAEEFTLYRDEEFEREFRGHLVLACCSQDADLELAEKITLRMQEEFGKAIFVETRVMSNANPEDNVFEVWLESYEVELLHSKRRASTGFKGWDGPAELDDEQLDKIVSRVRALISDEYRYSYTYEMDGVF